MGVHTGEAELREGDYFGSRRTGRRVSMSVAHGEQVLVSLSTAEVVRDSLPDGLALVDLGERRLRDLSRPERIFQVADGSLRVEFPALRSAGCLPGQPSAGVDVIRGSARRAGRAQQGAARGADGHDHGDWRCRQDAGRGSVGGRAAATLPGWRVVVRARGGDRRGSDGAGDRDDVVGAAAPGCLVGGRGPRVIAVEAGAGRARQLRAPPRRGGPSRGGDAARVRAPPGGRNQPRGARDRGRTGVATAVAARTRRDVTRCG